MKKIFLIWFLCPILFFSCSDDSTTVYVGNWVRKSDFEGVKRSGAASFCIGNNGYLFGGIDASKSKLYGDLWVYNLENDGWTKIISDTFKGTYRKYAAGFRVGTKGYVCCGYDGSTYLKDLWEFDPATGKWTKKADFPGTARYYAVAFGNDTYGFVGCGNDNNDQKDFYRYDPSTDTWKQVTSIKGAKREGAFVFQIGDLFYVGGGINNSSVVNDFYSYDPATDTWTELNKLTNVLTDETFDDEYVNIARAYGVGFTINSKGYVATGMGTSSTTNYVWEYDAVSDRWTRKTNLESTISNRIEGVGFTLGARGFFATGRSGSTSMDDMYEFKPDDEVNDNDN